MPRHVEILGPHRSQQRTSNGTSNDGTSRVGTWKIDKGYAIDGYDMICFYLELFAAKA